MVVAAEEALLACCEKPPNAFTLLAAHQAPNAFAAARPPNAAVLLPSIIASLDAPKPARFERDDLRPRSPP
jgi:hypothetical protein